jgi:hypothetical protein
MPTSRHGNMTARKHDDISIWLHDVQPGQAKEEKASGDHRQRGGFSETEKP